MFENQQQTSIVSRFGTNQYFFKVRETIPGANTHGRQCPWAHKKKATHFTSIYLNRDLNKLSYPNTVDQNHPTKISKPFRD